MYDINLVIPIYNEGEKTIKLLENFKKKINYKFQVLLCYDNLSDNVFDIKEKLNQLNIDIKYIKNPLDGPCEAIKEGLKNKQANCSIVYPADDFVNFDLVNSMYKLFLAGNEIVVPSRFIKGGSMKKCPLIKAILVRGASFFLYITKSVAVQDSTNGFRLFSKKILDTFEIESTLGFAYSIELLVKASKKNMKISELPAKWEERDDGSRSRFKIINWFPDYWRWFLYGLLK